MRKKIVSLAALIGFLAIISRSAALAPTPCCSASCAQCPLTLCKGTAADASPRVDTSRAPHPAFLPPLLLQEVAVLAAPLEDQVLRFLSHEFRRPMRN